MSTFYPSILNVSRRRFVQSVGLSGLAVSNLSIGSSHTADHSLSQPSSNVLSGKEFDLHIGYKAVNFDGQQRIATTVNNSLPAPLLRMREGDQVTLRVHNHLKEDSSIHWHGFIIPFHMDGVPGISFDGIKAGQTFTYQFTLKQSGTYWYHAHSGFQEQTGLIGGIIIEPQQGERHTVDREHVLVLSDWTNVDPTYLWSKLKKHSHFDNQHKPNLIKLIQDIKQHGFSQSMQLRQMWQQMRMSPTDFADLSGETFSYLINGVEPDNNWTGIFKRGEKVRLRIINASANTFFDLRIPDLKMTVIAADGQDIEPVSVDEIRLGAAETYDVIVQPVQDAYTIFAQNMDRSGFALGTLAVKTGLRAPVPALDNIEWLSTQDMMGDMQHHGTDHAAHAQHSRVKHASTEFNNPNVDMRVDQPRTNLDDVGVNLRQSAKIRKVLTYADLHTIGGSEDLREPSRNIELHLTGNMDRYVWGFDGQRFSEAKPIHLKPNERVRFTLVNDTMMTHPMHLHGMWSELRQPNGNFQVRKHTINVQPAQQISFDTTAIAGRWAWHCHLLYHMESGMFREVVVA
jgi:FtsP/CotA-like multicopper oxidase with cupredoxin domain